MDKRLIFTGAYRNDNWFYNKYWCAGANVRYHTFSTALNLLSQTINCPLIIETGCQRQQDDIGAGMSTSIFAEYIYKYGGNLITIDIDKENLSLAKKCVEIVNPTPSVSFIHSDSIKYLQGHKGRSPDLVYLDSFDYPYGDLLDIYGGREDIEKAEKEVWDIPADEFIKKHESIIKPCQDHCVNEYYAIKDKLKPTTILLLDDNLLPGGGKPRLLKDILLTEGWMCLSDDYQSLWVRTI